MVHKTACRRKYFYISCFLKKTINYTDGRIEAVEAQSNFDCTDRVWGVFEIKNLPSGRHQFKTKWINPLGEITHSKKVTVILEEKNSSFFLSSFIEIYQTGSILSVFEPSLGLEKFIGKWTVNILNGKETIGTSQFQIIC